MPITSRAGIGGIARAPGILSALVLAYVALLPYQFEVGKGVNLAPSDLFVLLALVLAAGQFRIRRPAWGPWHVALLATFAIGSLVASLRYGTLNRYELLNKDAGLLVPFLSYAAITSVVVGWDDVRRILRVFVFTVGLQNLVSVAGFLLAYFFGVDNPFARYGGLRLSGMLLDPNAYGGLLVAAFVINEGACVGPAPLFRRPMQRALRVTLAMGILFSFSRSAWVALSLAGIVFCILRTKAALRLAATVLLGAPCLFLLMGNRFVPVFEEMASRPKQVQGRFDLINDALQAFSSHPIVGGGIGSFRLSEGEIAHNTAMWFLADFGIWGFLVLVGFVGWFFAKAWAGYRLAPPREQPLALALLMAHTAMFGLAMGIEAFYQRHWWVVMALIASSRVLTTTRFRWDDTPPEPRELVQLSGETLLPEPLFSSRLSS